MKLSIIVAASDNGVIGKDGKIPWRIPADFRLFKEITMGHTLIMGRKTYESIGRPLPGRTTIVASRSRAEIPGVKVTATLGMAIAEAFAVTDEVFICGGAEVYSAVFPLATHLYLTRVHGEVEGDTIVPELVGGVPEGFEEAEPPVELSTEGATHRATLHLYKKV